MSPEAISKAINGRTHEASVGPLSKLVALRSPKPYRYQHVS